MRHPIRPVLAFLLLAFCLAPLAVQAQPTDAPARHVFPSLNGNFVAERVLSGLGQPAAIQFLPDGRALIAQRERGLVTLADFAAGTTADIGGLPKLVVEGDAGSSCARSSRST